MPFSEDRNRFVNPYTFVPFPTSVPRAAPPGHDAVEHAGEELLCGSIDVEWTLHTPLLLPANPIGQGWLTPAAGGASSLTIPGSSMKGAIRSLHETMFAGCIRVYDPDFVPVYREPARPRRERDGWVLGRLESARDDGVVDSVRLAENVVWIDAWQLKDAYPQRVPPRLPRTGDILDMEPTVERDDRYGRVEWTQLGGPVAFRTAANEVGGRILLVTERLSASPHVYWAAGTVSDLVVHIPSHVIERYEREVAGSNDVRRRANGQLTIPASGFLPVRAPRNGGPPVQVGERHPVDKLQIGNVVWVQVDSDDKVQRIVASALWRSEGAGTLQERVPPHMRPCTGSESESEDLCLCLSCTIFGSADTTGDDAGEGRQDSYRGHVRVGRAVATMHATPTEVDLAPLGSPRLGVGAFSLQEPKRGGLVEGERPGDWVSNDRVVGPGHRAVRGRKYYWHTDPIAQRDHWQQVLGRTVPLRHVRRRHQAEAAASGKRMLWPAGAILAQRITFSGLSRSSLLSLLLTIDPAPLLGRVRPGHGGFAQSLGGGKPFGLGAASGAIVGTEIWTLRGRYGEAAPEASPALDAASAADLIPRVRNVVGQVARVLDLAGLGELVQHVSYPPGGTMRVAATWDDVGTRAFDESFRWFSRNTGKQLHNGTTRLSPLPDLDADGDQTMDTL